MRLLRRTFYFSASAVLVLAAAVAALVAVNLATYTRLTHEQVAARVATRQLGERRYLLTLQESGGRSRQFELRGDEWQIDARMLKWRPWANVLGFDSLYRLERVSGRYTDIERERVEPRTVHPLSEPAGVDFWVVVRRYRAYLPLADAVYGSAAFVPMADGGEYTLNVSTTGLLVRPANEAARRAIGAWK